MPTSPAPRLHALVPCAGVGERAGTGGPKQYERLAGQSVVGHTLAVLGRVSRLHSTLVVLSAGDTLFERAAPGYTGLRLGFRRNAASGQWEWLFLVRGHG